MTLNGLYPFVTPSPLSMSRNFGYDETLCCGYVRFCSNTNFERGRYHKQLAQIIMSPLKAGNLTRTVT